MDVVTANLLGLFFVFILELVRRRDRKEVTNDFNVVMKAMGNSFANVVSILIGAAVFAEAIKLLGGITIISNVLASVKSAPIITMALMSMLSLIHILAMDLLSKDVGDRIAPISYYQEEFQVSRGTMQNAFNYLKDMGAVTLAHHGHQGTYIEALDYIKLQESCLQREIMGIMPLPYSQTYEGFATAIYEQFKRLKFNMAYARGAVGRIQMVESGTYQFAVVSQYAAEHAISCGREIECLMNFGAGSFLSKHILLLRDKSAEGIMDGMKVAYDEDSLDQSKITQNLTKKMCIRDRVAMPTTTRVWL